MNPQLRDRILRRLDALSDERAYQVLDFVDFLTSRYAERQAPPPSLLQRLAEGVEDTLRAGHVPAAAVAETMALLGKAAAVLEGVAEGARAVVAGATAAAARPSGGEPPPDAPPAPPPPPAAAERPQGY